MEVEVKSLEQQKEEILSQLSAEDISFFKDVLEQSSNYVDCSKSVIEFTSEVGTDGK